MNPAFLVFFEEHGDVSSCSGLWKPFSQMLRNMTGTYSCCFKGSDKLLFRFGLLCFFLPLCFVCVIVFFSSVVECHTVFSSGCRWHPLRENCGKTNKFDQPIRLTNPKQQVTLLEMHVFFSWRCFMDIWEHLADAFIQCSLQMRNITSNLS